MGATTNPVLSWDQRTLVVAESTFGTVPSPLANQYFAWQDLDMGPNEVQDTRYVKDKQLGRGPADALVRGRVKPMPFKGKTSCKVRSAVDAVPSESAVYTCGGLVQTVNTGVSVVYSLSSSPTLQGLSCYAALGASPLEYEQGFGGAVEELTWTGGKAEVTLDVSGKWAGKYSGGQASATVANGTNTSVTVDNAGDEYKLDVGWYQWESEIIYISAVQDGSGTFTCARAQLGSTGAAHTTKNLVPYLPALSQAPNVISEANLTCSIDGVTTRIQDFSVKFKTGIEHLPGESGSMRVQGLKVVRYGLEVEFTLTLTDDTQRLEGKLKAGKNTALVLTAGTGTGSTIQFSFPYATPKPFPVPAKNDVAVVKVPFWIRDNAGNDAMTITLT